MDQCQQLSVPVPIQVTAVLFVGKKVTRLKLFRINICSSVLKQVYELHLHKVKDREGKGRLYCFPSNKGILAK